MKHYLDLVPISVKIHRKQSRMSIFCIVLAVFLVTTIFGMADMFVRSQILQTQREYGNWHQNIEALNREILVELVDYIKVYENGNISVKFKFADELRKIAEYIEINTTEDTAVAG